MRLVVVAAQVQEAVDDVEGQFSLNIVAAFLRLGLRHLGADDQLAGQPVRAGLAEREAQHVGRLVVIEVALVEPVDRGIVDEGEADLGVVDAFTLRARPGPSPASAAVHLDDSCGLAILRDLDPDGKSAQGLQRRTRFIVSPSVTSVPSAANS